MRPRYFVVAIIVCLWSAMSVYANPGPVSGIVSGAEGGATFDAATGTWGFDGTVGVIGAMNHRTGFGVSVTAARLLNTSVDWVPVTLYYAPIVPVWPKLPISVMPFLYANASFLTSNSSSSGLGFDFKGQGGIGIAVGPNFGHGWSITTVPIWILLGMSTSGHLMLTMRTGLTALLTDRPRGYRKGELGGRSIESFRNPIFELAVRKALHKPTGPILSSDLPSITSLDLSHKSLYNIPAGVTKLTNLKSIDLSNNDLRYWPVQLVHLKKLARIDLSNNRITEVPPSSELPQVSVIDLAGNPVRSLDPSWLGGQITLRGISRQEWFGALAQFLGDRAATPAFSAFASAVYRSLGRPPGPISTGDLWTITSLDLSGENLTTLPHAIINLSSLRSIDLADNDFTAIPYRLADLRHLQEINLSHNRLTELSAPAPFPDVKQIEVAGNPLVSISPAWLDTSIDLKGLPLSVLRSSIEEAFGPDPPDGRMGYETWKRRATRAGQVLAEYASKGSDGSVTAPVVPVDADQFNMYLVQWTRMLVKSNFPPHYAAPSGAVAAGAVYMGDTVFPVFLIGKTNQKLAIDGNRDGRIEPGESAPVHALPHVFTLTLGGMPYYIMVKTVKEATNYFAAQDASKKALAFTYRSVTGALTEANGVAVIVTDKNTNGHFDDPNDNVYPVNAFGTLRGYQTFDNARFNSTNRPAILLCSATEREAVERPVSSRNLISRNAWQRGTARRRLLRFGMYRRLDDIATAEPGGVVLAAKDASIIYTTGDFSTGPLNKGMGGGPAPLAFAGTGSPLPSSAYPPSKRPTMLSWRDRVGDLFFPTVGFVNGGLQITWHRALNFSAKILGISSAEQKRLNANAPMSLVLSAKQLAAFAKSNSRKKSAVIQDYRFGDYIVSFGNGSDRKLVVLDRSGSVVRELGPGEYQFPRFGRNPDEILYVHNGLSSDEYVPQVPSSSGLLLRDDGSSKKTIARNVLYFKESADGTRYLYQQWLGSQAHRIVLQDASSGRTYELWRSQYDTLLTTAWGFVGTTDHVYYPKNRHLAVDDYVTGIAYTIPAFSYDLKYVYTIQDLRYVVRNPLSLAELSRKGVLWRSGNPPWRDSAMKVFLATAQNEVANHPSKVLAKINAMHQPSPHDYGYRRFELLRLTALEGMKQYRQAASFGEHLLTLPDFDNPGTAARILNIYEESSQFSKGIAAARRYLAAWPTSDGLQRLLAVMLLKNGSYLEAATEYRTYLSAILHGDMSSFAGKEFAFDRYLLDLVLVHRPHQAYKYLVAVDPLKNDAKEVSIGVSWGIPSGALGQSVRLVASFRIPLFAYLYCAEKDRSALNRLMRTENTSYTLSADSYLYILAAQRSLHSGRLPADTFSLPITSENALAAATAINRSVGYARKWASRQHNPVLERALVDLALGNAGASAAVEKYLAASPDPFWVILLKAVE